MGSLELPCIYMTVNPWYLKSALLLDCQFPKCEDYMCYSYPVTVTKGFSEEVPLNRCVPVNWCVPQTSVLPTEK